MGYSYLEIVSFLLRREFFLNKFKLFIDNLITQEQAAKKNPATLKRLLSLSLADLTKLQELHQRKYDEHSLQINYLANTESAIKFNGEIEKSKELEIITLLIREALDIRYSNIFKDKINIPSN